MVLIDGQGMFAFCNEAAELMLGRSFGDMGTLTASELGAILDFRGLDGEPLRRRDTPPGRAFLQREPAHQRLLVTAFDGTQREVEATAYPLIGRDQEMHGVLVVFWEAGT
jgi:PAS domain-containing protein